MKKIFLAAMAGTAVLALSACGDNDADDVATSTDTTMATTEVYATPAPADTVTVDEGATDTATTTTDTTTSADGATTTSSTTTAQ
jgi:hypothetical protein